MNRKLLDDYCNNIFAFLAVSDKTFRFTELYKTLNKIGLKMSKPTLINHLHHLQKRKLLIRKIEGKQNISYAVNWKKLETLKESTKTRQALKHLLQNKKRFKSFPIDEQVTYVTNIMTLTNLYRLKLEVQDMLDPSKNFEHSVQFLFTNRFFEFFKTWLLESCQEAKTTNGQQALEMIDQNITRITNILFDKKQ
jgi:hypothetical protein